MNTLKITINGQLVKEFEIVGELPTMNTLSPVPCDGGYTVAISGYELKSGGILNHLRQISILRPIE